MTDIVIALYDRHHFFKWRYTMSYGKAVEEVWKWRDALEKELESVPEKERVKYLNQKAEGACHKLRIKCRYAKRRSYTAPDKKQ